MGRSVNAIISAKEKCWAQRGVPHRLVKEGELTDAGVLIARKGQIMRKTDVAHFENVSDFFTGFEDGPAAAPVAADGGKSPSPVAAAKKEKVK
jgi:hypothetical protein